MVKKVLLAFFTFTLFWSCSKLSPKIAAPAYLEIDGYKVITDSQTQGTNYQKFTDVLITSSTTNYGYYPIPGKIPLPFNGNNYLIIRPVIEVNGVSALRVDYPLMKGCDTVLPLNGGGQLNKFRPTFKYFPNVNFRFKEDFEAASTSMVNSNSADTFGVKTDFSQHFNGGQKCLLMQLDANHTSCQAQSSYAFHLPNDGTSIYLEINYKCNTNFEVGLIGT
ncbi:MAG TPA: hypothetical protein VNY73_08155, partial [Bacteroidia bacterium]|nr:hypothetical protein [Bacteroidia bacterium]